MMMVHLEMISKNMSRKVALATLVLRASAEALGGIDINYKGASPPSENGHGFNSHGWRGHGPPY